MKTNIFQGDFGKKNPIQKILFPELVLPDDEFDRQMANFDKTHDIYFQAFFYLTKRFGESNKIRIDDYKDAGRWDFAVKNYSVTVLIDSCSVNFVIFGEQGTWLSHNTPYRIKKERFDWKNNAAIDVFNVQEKDVPAFNQLATEFCAENDISESDFFNLVNSDMKTWEAFSEKVFAYNNKVRGFSFESVTEKHGTYYDNAKKRHALKTLEQFLKNMLSPITIRDCYFNIKGRVSDDDYFNCVRYKNNIKIERKPDRK